MVCVYVCVWHVCVCLCVCRMYVLCGGVGVVCVCVCVCVCVVCGVHREERRVEERERQGATFSVSTSIFAPQLKDP